jgi:preprotein translocase subunit SecG
VENFISFGVIIVSILLIATILLQVRGSSSVGLFGSFETSFRTRRGLEKALFQLTIGLAVLFAALAIANIRL